MANYDLIYPGQTIDQLLTTAYYLKNAGYIFLGSASSYSGTPTQRAWLIAPSGFTGFGFSEAIPIGSMGICLYNGTSWSGVTINVVTVDETMRAGSDNPISSGAVYDTLSTITQGISAQLDSLELADATDPSDILDVLTVALKMTRGGFNVVVSSLDILSATASKAGLMSAADKIKLDGFLNNIRSMVFADTTPSSDLGTKIVESLKWTVDNVQEVITTLTILAASTEKAGLMSAADKAYVDGLPATLGTLTSSLQDMLVSILSIVFDDTTPSSDKANKIVETMKWTSGGIQRAITTLTILSATASKAGLMSAADKAYVDGLPATLTSLSNSISSIRTDLLNYYSKTEVDTLLDGKQDVIDDLASIRSGAAAGATAVQPADMNSAISSVRASIGYYECSTAAGTAAKTVSASGYTLTNGGCIRIKMTNANTADNATLNINGTGAKALFYDGAQASSANTWEAGEVLEVYYDGTQFQCASGGGGKFASGEKVKDTSITDEVTAGDTALPTGGAVAEAIFNGSTFGEKELPIPSVERNFILNMQGEYTGNTYAHHKIIPVNSGMTIKVVANSNYDSILAFLTASDIDAATGSVASITSDGNIYAILKNSTYYFTSPDDANFVVFNTVEGSHGQNQRIVQPQAVSLMLDMGYLEGQIKDINSPYSSNTSQVDVSGFVSKTYNFTSGGKYSGTSGNHNYWLDVIAGSVYTITSGDSAINIGWLKSKTAPKNNNYADLSLYDGKVYVLASNSSITIEAPQDAVVMIVSIVPSAVVVYAEKTYKEQVNENVTNIVTLRNDVDKLKVPVNPITIPSTSYSYWFSYTGSYTGNSGLKHVYLPVTSGHTYRIIGGEVTNYAAFLTQNDGSIAVNTRASLTSDGKIYTIGVGVSVDMEAPQDARYIVFNTNNGTSSIVVSGFGEMLPLDEYLTAEHDPQTIFDFNPSWVVGNLILQARRKLNLNASGGSGTQPLVLLHCSDIHSDKESWDRLIQFYNKYKERIDGAICTGDMCAQTIDSDKSFLSNGGNTVMLTLGNHDVAKTSWNVYDATAQECYEGLFAPYIENWGVQRPSGATYECYYYKDYPTQKVRLIVLDTSVGANSNEQHWNNVQLSWLQSTLESAITDGLSVVIAQHYWAVNSNGRTYVDCTFTCKNPLSEGEAIIPTDARTAVQSFIDAGGTFICWLSGHTHRDFVYYPTANPKQLGIVVDCASGYASIPKQVCDEDRQAGTKSIDAFNILGIDTYRKIIKVVRIGSDTDSLMRHKGVLCVKYGGNVPEVIFNN